MSDPRIWGGDLWKTLHRLSLAYPDAPADDDRQAAYELLHSLTRLLPCPACRAHYAKHFATFDRDATTASRDALVRWVHELHESVNRRLHKKHTGTVTVGDLPRLYQAFPMRYVDTASGALLGTPRYDTTGSVVCPSDKKARRALGRRIEKLSRAHTRMLGSVAKAQGSNDEGKMNETSAMASSSSPSSKSNGADNPSAATWWWIIGAIVAAVVLVLIVALISVLVQQSRNRRRPIRAVSSSPPPN